MEGTNCEAIASAVGWPLDCVVAACSWKAAGFASDSVLLWRIATREMTVALGRSVTMSGDGVIADCAALIPCLTVSAAIVGVDG